MAHIENIEIVWNSIDCFDPKILVNMFYGVLNRKNECLIKRANGLVEYVEIGSPEMFKKEMSNDDLANTYFTSGAGDVASLNEISSYLDQHEIVLYRKVYYTEYGDCAGTETAIYDDATEIALIPNLNTIDALINANLDY
jgi:hypothetical protein